MLICLGQGYKNCHYKCASTAIDLENGRALESPWISDSVPKLANQVGLQAPLNASLYALLKSRENSSLTGLCL